MLCLDDGFKGTVKFVLVQLERNSPESLVQEKQSFVLLTLEIEIVISFPDEEKAAKRKSVLHLIRNVYYRQMYLLSSQRRRSSHPLKYCETLIHQRSREKRRMPRARLTVHNPKSVQCELLNKNEFKAFLIISPRV